MKRHFAIASFATLVLASCSPSATQKAAEIHKLEDQLLESSKKNIADTTGVKQLMGDYMAYYKAYPADTMTPTYMMKLAKFYDGVQLTDSALFFYDQVYKNYPNYPKVSVALFSEAFIYNNEKHDLSKAALLYKIYLDKYPNSVLAKSATVELHNLGKTPEQIMAEMDSIRQAHADSATAKK